jgi:hypothetical protein
LYRASVTERGWLVVRRAGASGRYRRGTYGVFIDGEHSGDVRDGQSVEIALDVGDHDVQVGTMTYPYSGTPRLLGSPPLPIEVRVGERCRVVATPSGASLLRQTASPEGLLVLTVEGDTGQVRSTSVPATATTAGPLDPVARNRNFLTAGMIDAERPWRTWQAIVTSTCLAFCLWIVVASLFFTRSASSGGWIVAVVFGLLGAVFALQLLTATRVRRENRERHQAG